MKKGNKYQGKRKKIHVLNICRTLGLEIFCFISLGNILCEYLRCLFDYY